MRTFTITDDHITLLRAADWDNGEGTPGIDWKRPYLGTSSVRSALAELLIPGWKEMSDEQMEAVRDENDDRLWDIHTDLGTVVAIGIDTLSFAPGTYVKTGDRWEPEGGQPRPADLERRIRQAISDPGSFLRRGDDYTESIPRWGTRAVLVVLAEAGLIAGEDDL